MHAHPRLYKHVVLTMILSVSFKRGLSLSIYSMFLADVYEWRVFFFYCFFVLGVVFFFFLRGWLFAYKLFQCSSHQNNVEKACSVAKSVWRPKQKVKKKRPISISSAATRQWNTITNCLIFYSNEDYKQLHNLLAFLQYYIEKAHRSLWDYI